MKKFFVMCLILLCLSGCSKNDYKIEYVSAVEQQEGLFSESSCCLNEVAKNNVIVDISDVQDSAEFCIPTQNYVLTSHFGARWGTVHRGVDLAVPVGTPVYASRSGIIESLNNDNSGYGISIVLRHDDKYQTRYAHLSGFADVSQGDFVQQGQLIGYSGNTGNSTGPHLHFEILIDGIQADPENYLKF